MDKVNISPLESNLSLSCNNELLQSRYENVIFHKGLSRILTRCNFSLQNRQNQTSTLEHAKNDLAGFRTCEKSFSWF